MEANKKILLGMNVDELKALVVSLGMPAFTAKQIAKWMYDANVKDIDQMTNISKANRLKISENCTIGAVPPLDCQKSKDGTIKYLFPRQAASLSRQCISPMATGQHYACRRRWAAR